MLTVSVCTLHHQQIAFLSFRRTGVNDLAGGNLTVAHASDVASEQQFLSLAIRRQGDLHHGRAEDMRRADETERQAALQLLYFPEIYGTEERHALLRFFQGIKR